MSRRIDSLQKITIIIIIIIIIIVKLKKEL